MSAFPSSKSNGEPFQYTPQPLPPYISAAEKEQEKRRLDNAAEIRALAREKRDAEAHEMQMAAAKAALEQQKQGRFMLLKKPLDGVRRFSRLIS